MSTDSHLDTGAMALDSLPPDEAAEFADHLTTCPTCSAELIGFLETAALLGAAVAQTPPASLRRTIMAAIRITPQLPPITGAGPESAQPGRHRSSDADQPVAPVVPLRRPWYRRPQAYLAAAAAAVVIAGGTTLIVANSGNQQQAQPCAATASDRQTATGSVAGPAATIVYSVACQQATVTIATLPALPSDQVYQLWALRNADPATARSEGVVTTNANGALESVPAALQPGETDLAISVETAPGPAASPSPKIVWVAHL